MNNPAYQKVLENYRETYKNFMSYTDAQVPDDETLIFIALMNDMDDMKKRLNE